MGPYLGDYENAAVVYFCWGSNDKDGASITRATNGTIKVYKNNYIVECVNGITDIEDIDGLTGVHSCKIDLSSDDFYAAGFDYSVVLVGAVVDGETVNAVLASFSIENRFSSNDKIKKAVKLLVNKAVQDKSSGEIKYYDDDGETVLLTHTPNEGELTITRNPS